MVDRYWRKIESVENDIENSMQISSILLKLKGYDEKLFDLSKIGDNKNNISSNLGKIDENKDNISSNLAKIDTNKDNILSLKNSNIKSFYNLDKIFIYNIKKGDHLVNKDNYYHIFEKEIMHKFIKDSYLDIILKVLTEISNYVLIGFFSNIM